MATCTRLRSRWTRCNLFADLSSTVFGRSAAAPSPRWRATGAQTQGTAVRRSTRASGCLGRLRWTLLGCCCRCRDRLCAIVT
jgi:hypothetical protein